MTPIYRARNDLVVGLQKNGTVAEVVEEGYDGRLNVQTVEPKSEDTSLTLTFSIKVLDISLLFLSDGIKTRVGVEQVGDESKVELGVTGDERLGGQEFAAVELVGVVKDLFGTLHEVVGLEGGARADFGLELVEKDGVVLAVLDVAREV
jgi:hypothetical protein